MRLVAARGKRISGTRKPQLPLDPVESAKFAGLRYVTGEGPGIRRKRAGKSFTYLDTEGKTIRDAATLERIRSLVIPPAWTDVWICPNPNGHLQAHGRDEKGRKQYRYHPAYRQVRDATKYHRMKAFGEALPKIRERVAADLQLTGLPKRKVLATVVKLLDETSIRIGNEEYAKDNESYGLTTMRDQHVKVEGSKMKFHFRGKSGQMHDIEVTDKRLARIVKQCQDVDGQELFQYIDENGEHAKIDSSDVNEYLREITGADFTAKDFRTWTGSGHALQALKLLGKAESESDAKKKIVAAIKEAAHKLGNRPATCRKYYVHPAILDSFVSGILFEMRTAGSTVKSAYDLRDEEQFVLMLVDQYIAPCAAPARKAS